MNELLTKGIGHTEFKDSPVGKIPVGWEVKKFGECVERFYQGINTVADKVVYERKGIPILQAKHITSGYISIGGAKFVSQVDFAIYKDKYNPRKGDVLLTNIGTIGKTVLVQEDEELLIAWNVFLIGVNDKVQSKFLNYYLQRLDGLNFYENLMTGNATKFVNKTSLSEIEILSPPLPEQQKIASILTSVDEVIEKTQSQINKLQDLKKGTMNELLTKGIGHTEFKDSPVGKIPVGWEVKKFGECVERFYQGINTVADKVVYERKGIPILQAKHITSGYISIGGAKFVSQVDFAIYKDKYNPRKGDVLLTNIGTIGKTVLVQEDEELLIAWNVFLIGVNDKVQSKFLNYYLQRLDGLNFYENLMTGNATKFVNKTSLSEIEILSPPLPEQQKIASILTSVDEVIEKTQSQINKLQDLKKGTMNELLTKGIGHTEFKDSPVGKIPVEWEVQEIESVINNLIDYRGKSPPKYSSGVPLLTAKNIRKGYIDSEPREFIEEDKFDSWMVRGIPTVGDVFFTTEAPLGNVALVPDYKFAIGQRVIALCPDVDKLNSVYLLYVLQGEIVKKQLFLDSTGSTVSGVKQSTFRKILILSPPLPEQQKIASILSSMDSYIEEKQRKLQQTQSLKKSLMQDLLTGKVRVTVH